MFLIEIELHHVSPFFPPASLVALSWTPFMHSPQDLCVSRSIRHRWVSAKWGKQRASDPQELELEADVSHPRRCWDLNLVSLQKKYALLTAESLF